MKTTKKAFAIVLLVLSLPIWLFQWGIRNLMSYDHFRSYTVNVKDYLDVQLLQFPEVYNAGRFLSSIAWLAKFFEALILPFCIVAAILILRNSTKKKITLIPGIVLLVIAIFDLACIIVCNVINNIEIIDTTASLLRYYGVSVDLVYPVIHPIQLTINSTLLSIPAIGFLVCAIVDIIHLKKNPDDAVKEPADPKHKKALIFYCLSAASIIILLLVASLISASSNVATLTWIFKYFWQGYILFIIAAIVFYVIGNSMTPAKKAKKENVAQPNVTVQQVSSADELKKYKELLDAGIITQEEFDAKKRQLLGL